MSEIAEPTLTRLEWSLVMIIERIAANNERCPSNMELAEELGMSKMSAPSAVLKSLEDRGILIVERRNSARRVTILSSGKSTRSLDTQPDEKKDAPRKVQHHVSHTLDREAPAPVIRDPCFGCGVLYDRHEEHGCRRWRGAL